MSVLVVGVVGMVLFGAASAFTSSIVLEVITGMFGLMNAAVTVVLAWVLARHQPLRREHDERHDTDREEASRDAS